MEGSNMIEIIGYFFMICGFIIFRANWITGIVLVVFGIILVINPSEEGIRGYIGEDATLIMDVISIVFIMVGIVTVALGIVVFRNPLTISIGLGLLLLGLVIIPQSSREGPSRSIRESPEERSVPRKKPKSFSKVKEKEYAGIPEDAIDPYTEERIHDLIAQGKSIIRCRDCGAYYDKEVWEHYGKICVRIGCSNAEV